MIEIYNPSSFQTGAELVYTYRGFRALEDKIKGELKSKGTQDDFEKKRLAGEYDLVDFDIAGDVSRFLSVRAQERLARYPIVSLQQGISRLLNLRASFDKTSLDGEFLIKRVEATIVYLQVLSGRKIPTQEYIETTLGLDANSKALSPISEEEIAAFWKDQILHRFSLCSDLDLTTDNREVWNKYVRSNREVPTRSAFRKMEEILIPIMQKNLKIQERPNYRIISADVPAYWINWTTYDQYGFLLKINTNESIKSRFYKGVVERLFIHEVLTHAYEAHFYSENIRLGKINPGYGILTVPGPEQHGEGKANTLAYFIPELYEALSPEAKFALDYRVYEGLVQRNAHLYANKISDFKGDVKDYLMQNLPSMDEKRAETFIKNVTEDPRDKVYRLTYGFAYEYWQYAKRLNPKPKQPTKEEIDKRILFVLKSFERPRTFSQTEDLVQEIESISEIRQNENPSLLVPF